MACPIRDRQMPSQSELERCPECGCGGLTVQTRKTTTGQRRRRHECQKCQHRWSTWSMLRLGEAPMPKAHRKPQKRALSDEQLLEVLVTRSKVPASVLAREWGISSWPIGQARRGQGYTDRLPHLARGSCCLTCSSWRSYGCGLGFPEAHLEGPGFAAECAAFVAA